MRNVYDISLNIYKNVTYAVLNAVLLKYIFCYITLLNK